MRKKEERNAKTFQFRTMLIGVSVALLLSLLLAALGAWLIAAGKVGENTALEISLVSLFLAAMAGGGFTAKKSGKNQLLYGAAVGAALVAIRLLFSAFQEDTEIFGANTFAAVGCMMAGGVCGSALTLRRRKKKRR